MPEVEIDDVIANKTFAMPSSGIAKKYKDMTNKIIKIPKCKSS